ncbi:MAG: hypothetical protein VW602_03500 [Paracoccaceae bacterium]
MTEAYIYDAIRTPRGRGKSDGSLHTVKPLDLVVGLIDEVRARFPDMDVNRIDDAESPHIGQTAGVFLSNSRTKS